jgi:hypothetical protein
MISITDPAVQPASAPSAAPEAFPLANPDEASATIEQYFVLLNAGQFDEVAALFATEGVLYPPFDDGLVGPEAIAVYLKAEAKGMQLQPRRMIYESLPTGEVQFQVNGKVQTPLFGVNVTWYFVINARNEILSVGVKLLAALEELLHLKRD